MVDGEAFTLLFQKMKSDDVIEVKSRTSQRSFSAGPSNEFEIRAGQKFPASRTSFIRYHGGNDFTDRSGLAVVVVLLARRKIQDASSALWLQLLSF